MNIYANEGDKVIFTGRGGHDKENADARKQLKVGETYTVAETDVFGWNTDVYLKEFPGKPFNSVLFKDAEEQE